VSFYRNEKRPLREAAWVLALPLGTLGGWDQQFDEQMNPYQIIDGRGKACKVSIEVVRRLVDEAQKLDGQGRRLRIKTFTQHLKKDLKLNLSSKTVAEILIANDLYRARTRRKRPKYYRSLRQRIPNGLLSLDGSQIEVGVNGLRHKFTVELAVDVGSFCHTGFGIHRTETADAVIEAIEAHRRQWGTPLGVVFDSGSANSSGKVHCYLKEHGIEPVPAGPANPKGNGTDEGAFSQMKTTLGPIGIDASSPAALARSVLEKLVSIYITMRNQIVLHRSSLPPGEHMKEPVTETQRQEERQRLAAHKQAKKGTDADRPKKDRLAWVIKRHGLCPEPAELERAYRLIKSFDLQAIEKSEQAFVKAINRDANRKNLSYFFGILRNIQRDVDQARYRLYCRERYNYEIMCEEQRRLQQQQELNAPAKLEDILAMAVHAVTQKLRYLKELAERKTRESILQLLGSVRYVEPLRKKLADAVGGLNDLDGTDKQKVWELIERILNLKIAQEGVTLVS
jgi:hypothetical protein